MTYDIRGLPQKKNTTGKMSIVENPHKRARCKICGEKIMDDYMVCVDGYIAGTYGKVNYYYYHIICVRRLS